MVDIITVKIGTKYSSTYVNRVFDMCTSHLTYPFTFYCYTDDPTGLNPEIIPLSFVDNGLQPIVHNKLFLFSKEFEKTLSSSAPRIFFDLDIVIKSNIDDLVIFAWNNKEPLAVINASWKQYTQDELKEDINLHPINSSCMVWKPFNNTDIWDHFISNRENMKSRYSKGMDAYLFYEHNISGMLPEHLFRSYIFGIPRKYSRLATTFDNYTRIANRFPIVLFNGPTTEEDVDTFVKSNYTSVFIDIEEMFSSDKQVVKLARNEAENILIERMASLT